MPVPTLEKYLRGKWGYGETADHSEIEGLGSNPDVAMYRPQGPKQINWPLEPLSHCTRNGENGKLRITTFHTSANRSTESRLSKKYSHSHVNSSVIRNSPGREATQVFTDGRMEMRTMEPSCRVKHYPASKRKAILMHATTWTSY